MSSDEAPSLLNGDDVEEEEEEESLKDEPCRCLFCECELASATAALDHCRADHGVDLISIAAKLGTLLCPLQCVAVKYLSQTTIFTPASS